MSKAIGDNVFLWWQSKFEFQLRLQEFIEMVRAENMMRAITYARKYLAPWGSTHMKELQRVMATLAFRSNTECAIYKVSTFFSWTSTFSSRTSMIEDLIYWLIHAEEIKHLKQFLEQYIYLLPVHQGRYFLCLNHHSSAGSIWCKAMGLPSWPIQTGVLQIIWHDSWAIAEYIPSSWPFCIENSVSIQHYFFHYLTQYIHFITHRPNFLYLIS